MGSLPEWYTLVRAARYLGVAPWELLEQQSAWMDWALMAESAENEAQEIVARQRRKS
jgi:hypothetical protein